MLARTLLCLIMIAEIMGTVSMAGQQPTSKTVDGAALFSVRCHLCHGPGGRATQLSALSRRRAQSIYEAITIGSMQEPAAGLSETERHVLADYIATQEPQPSRLISCGQDKQPPRRAATGSIWNGWSPDLGNRRFQPAAQASLSAEQVPKLELKWAFVFPDAVTAANQATVVNGRLYIGSWDGTVYAFDAQTGCSYWTFKADAGVRVPVTVAKGLALFGDLHANVYAVDTLTGKLLWRTKVEDHSWARITGSPVAYQERLYVPVASMEEEAATDPKYPCCTFRGSIVALEIPSGRQLWKAYTIDVVAKRIGVNLVGTARFGPAGAGVWSAPTIDTKRGVLYVGTGNNYNEPDTPMADAVVAYDLNTGAKKWVRTLLSSDHFNVSCLSPEKLNCPPGEGQDFDFGASPILVRPSHGGELLLAGQKSGILYALDPDKEGAIVWQIRLGRGGYYGGIEFGLAADNDYAYVAIADLEYPTTRAEGALNAVDLKSGTRIWRTPNPADGCKDRHPACSIANAAPVTAIPGVAFVGSMDGRLRAYDARTGKIIWHYDTGTEVSGLNGLKGHGGSISGAGVTVAGGLLYQTSGYAAFGLGMPGNVLLVFGSR